MLRLIEEGDACSKPRLDANVLRYWRGASGPACWRLWINYLLQKVPQASPVRRAARF